MILDRLENGPLYAALNSGFAEAFEFLRGADPARMAVGRHEIDGDRLYALVLKEQGRRREEGMLEVHRRYVDIQLVVAGIDEMGWKPGALCRRASGVYNFEKDIEFFSDAPETWFQVGAGMVAIFFPDDAHLPLISTGLVHKIVVKVALEEK